MYIVYLICVVLCCVVLSRIELQLFGCDVNEDRDNNSDLNLASCFSVCL